MAHPQPPRTSHSSSNSSEPGHAGASRTERPAAEETDQHWNDGDGEVGDDQWRPLHLGRLLGEAMRRFDERVLYLMAHALDVPLALSNLAARGQISAAHVHITRHLPPAGARLVDLAQGAGMTKQAMGDLVDQCVAWGLVTREPDPRDARARLICFTTAGLAWQLAFRQSVAQAEREFTAAVGRDVAAVVRIGLEVYAVGS